VVVALGDKVWVCECEEHRLVESDPANDKVARNLTFAQAGFLVGLSDTAGATTLWLLDFEAATLTPIDATTGTAGQPIGIGANLHGATVAFGALPLSAAAFGSPSVLSARRSSACPPCRSMWRR